MSDFNDDVFAGRIISRAMIWQAACERVQFKFYSQRYKDLMYSYIMYVMASFTVLSYIGCSKYPQVDASLTLIMYKTCNEKDTISLSY